MIIGDSVKKIILVLLFALTGCADTDSTLLLTHQKEDADTAIIKVQNEMQLVKMINESILEQNNTITYTADEALDLDEIVRMLSYLIPFDIQYTQVSYVDKGIPCYTLKLQYIDTEYEKVIASLKQIIKDNHVNKMSNASKIAFAHDYIIDHCEYDETVNSRNENNEAAFQIQGVLFERLAVCSGYSRCFLMMMRLLDIPCLYVASDEINHSFNLVYENDYRFIDVTWDENENRYYQLDKNAFFKDGKHQLDKQYNAEYFINFLSYIYHLD